MALVPVTAGCMALATTLVRDGHTDLGEFAAVLRRPWLALGLGVAQLAVGAVLVVDLLVGAALGTAIGGVLVVSAVYGLAILWIYAVDRVADRAGSGTTGRLPGEPAAPGRRCC